VNLTGCRTLKNVVGSGYPIGPVPSVLNPPENFAFTAALKADRAWHDMQDDVSTKPPSVTELPNLVPHAL
jgi:hypothetical protein